MDKLLIIIILVCGTGIGLVLGYFIRKLIFEKHSITKKVFDDLKRELETVTSDHRFAKSEYERIHRDITSRDEEIKSLRAHIQEITVEKAEIAVKIQTYEESDKKGKELMKEISSKFEQEQQINISHQNEKSGLQAKLQSAEQKNSEISTDLQTCRQKLNETVDEFMKVKEQLTSFQEKNINLQEKLETQKKELEEIGQKFSTEFQLLADKILEQKSIKFAELNQDNMKKILEPLGQNISEFKRKVEETYDKESKERFSLAEKVKELSDLNQKISQEAHNLTQALKGSVKQQGNWGEMLLESILQNSGLRRDFEYSVQSFIRDDSGETIKDEEGRKLQPDVVVHLPDDRQIVIDSKVSLVAYDRYIAAEDKHGQTIALAEHVRSIKAHIDGLSVKSYQTHLKSLDFVMLFVPIEPAYMVAMQHDTVLWEYAYKKRILLISPTNLIAALKLVADLWQREQQNKNAMKIAERGAQLYEKFVSFVESLEDIGKKIEGAQKSYTSAMNQLSTGRGNLIRQVEMLNELGVKAQKSIPSHLIDNDDEPKSLPE